MSVTTKKKHVTKEVLEEYPLPDTSKQLVKVTAPKGNNLHEVETSEGHKFLVSMPTKFRKHVWIKRGDFILVEPIAEGVKVKAEISHILLKDQIKYIKEQGLWPEAFSEKEVPTSCDTIPLDMLPPSDDEEDVADMCVNVNRVTLQDEDDEESTEDESTDDEEEEEKVEDASCKSTKVQLEEETEANVT